MLRMLTDDEYLERMAAAIHNVSNRRDTSLIQGWKYLSEEKRMFFLDRGCYGQVRFDRRLFAALLLVGQLDGRPKPAFEKITTEQLRQAQANTVHPSDIARVERAPGSRIERILKPSSYKF